MADLVETTSLAPPGEPPEGDVELALQEELVASDAEAPLAPAPPVVGRTYRLDIESGRLQPEGVAPAPIFGEPAMRQAVAKALGTTRGSAAVQGDDYGLDDADREVEGQAFDAAAFADAEQRVRDCLLGLPWVLDVQDYDVVEAPEDTATGAVVRFRVVPEGDDEPIEFDRFPLPSP